MKPIARSALLAAALALIASAPIALHPGDAVTDGELFSYLAFPVQPGEWVRYRVTFAGRSTVVKTIGFGRESVGGTSTLYIETHVRVYPVTGLPAETTTGIGDDAILKTYVAGSAFGDLAHPYQVIASALHVGSFEYEVSPGFDESYSALSGAVYAPPRNGTVQSVEPEDMQIDGRTIHATHVVATFPTIELPVGGVSAAYGLELWQSPDVPLGTVAISSGGPRAVRWRLISFGRGGFRSLFSRTLDQIRSASQPAMP